MKKRAAMYGSRLAIVLSLTFGFFLLSSDCCHSQTLFQRGDVNVDGVKDLTDAILILTNRFFGIPAQLDCEDATDLDDNGKKELTDAIHLMTFLFLGGVQTHVPFFSCGLDTTPDGLDCQKFDACRGTTPLGPLIGPPVDVLLPAEVLPRSGELRILDNVAYMLSTNSLPTGEAGIVAVDVSNSAAPVSLGSSPGIGGFPGSFDIDSTGNFAYVVSWCCRLFVFDISNPANMELVYDDTTNFPLDSVIQSVLVDGAYAYLGMLNNEVVVMDVSDPTDPEMVAATISVGQGNRIALAQNFLYVKSEGALGGGDQPGLLTVVNVVNPTNPVEVGSVVTDVGGWIDLDMVHTVGVQGDYVYTTNFLSRSLQIFDVSNPALPTEVGRVEFTGRPTNLALDGSFAFVIADDERLTVVDISFPFDPQVFSSVETVDAPAGLYIADGYVYISSFTEPKLQVFSVLGEFVP